MQREKTIYMVLDIISVSTPVLINGTKAQANKINRQITHVQAKISVTFQRNNTYLLPKDCSRLSIICLNQILQNKNR